MSSLLVPFRGTIASSRDVSQEFPGLAPAALTFAFPRSRRKQFATLQHDEQTKNTWSMSRAAADDDSGDEGDVVNLSDFTFRDPLIFIDPTADLQQVLASKTIGA
jgi:hypothetical protein